MSYQIKCLCVCSREVQYTCKRVDTLHAPVPFLFPNSVSIDQRDWIQDPANTSELVIKNETIKSQQRTSTVSSGTPLAISNTYSSGCLLYKRNCKGNVGYANWARCYCWKCKFSWLRLCKPVPRCFVLYKKSPRITSFILDRITRFKSHSIFYRSFVPNIYWYDMYWPR